MLTSLRDSTYTQGMTTTTATTIIGTMAAALENHTTQQLLEIAQECQRQDDQDTRLIKFAAMDIIEARNPAVIPAMQAWCNDLTVTVSYVDQLAVELAKIGSIK
jgi:hypothetical protein